MEHENGNWEILTLPGKNYSNGAGGVWGVAALTGYGITPVDRIMSECVIEGNVREREGTAGISTGRCLRGLKWYWGLPLCEILGALLSSRVHSEWQARAVCCPNHLACPG